MDTALYILTWAAFLGGGFFLIVGGIGLLRFPDFYENACHRYDGYLGCGVDVARNDASRIDANGS